MDNLFSRITGEQPLSENPNYNLIQLDKYNYELSVSVPGYKKEELEVSIINNRLNINSKSKKEKEKETKKINWIHQGILKNNFSISFKLEHKIKIKYANLKHGILNLSFFYDLPDQEKPKKISINEEHDHKCNI
uniref:Small heat shock protein ibp n=1 Tax=Wigglesworthia glossinidia brevipalpis TaxID=36870 RepID=IBP_WIGBR|nr:RecName: Full=Small heat shock protein ibp [Wigglesworthia glossinidia endosymbiont of Glossina brevipalpis]